MTRKYAAPPPMGTPEFREMIREVDKLTKMQEEEKARQKQQQQEDDVPMMPTRDVVPEYSGSLEEERKSKSLDYLMKTVDTTAQQHQGERDPDQGGFNLNESMLPPMMEVDDPPEDSSEEEEEEDDEGERAGSRGGTTQKILLDSANPMVKPVIQHTNLKFKSLNRSIFKLKVRSKEAKVWMDNMEKKVDKLLSHMEVLAAKQTVTSRQREIEVELDLPLKTQEAVFNICENPENKIAFEEWVNYLPVKEGSSKWAHSTLERTFSPDVRPYLRHHLQLKMGDYHPETTWCELGRKILVLHPGFMDVINTKIKTLDTKENKDKLIEQAHNYIRNAGTRYRATRIEELEKR